MGTKRAGKLPAYFEGGFEVNNQSENVILIKRGLEEYLPPEASEGELLVTLDTENLYVGKGPDNQLILLTPVKSVNGKTGIIELGKNDIGLSNVLDKEQASKEDFEEHVALGVEAHGGLVADTDPRLSDSRTPTEHGNDLHDQDYITTEEAPVQSVNGQTGVIELEFGKEDVGLGNLDNVKQMPKAGGTFEGDVDLNNYALIRPKIEQYSETLVSKLDQMGIVTLDLSEGNVFHVTQGEESIEYEFLCPLLPSAALTFTLIHTFSQEEQAIIFPTSVRWANDEIPNGPALGISAVYTFFTIDSGESWIGAQAINGLNLSLGEGE